MKILLLSVLLLFVYSCSVPTIVILKDPLSWEEHIDLGYIYERQGKLDLAEEEYKKAIRKNKRAWIAYYNLGNVYVKRGDLEKAEEFYFKALQLERDPDLLNNLAYVLNKRGDTCLALKLIREALQKKEREEYKKNLKEIEEKGKNCLPFEGEGEFW
ncbi:MAG: tetratricopeptide repeat protein [Aquificaceae bacterium]